MKFNFKKKFGQNFLNDETIIKKIAYSINPDSDDLIIEIGPGSGALTKYFKEMNCYTRCFEIDTELHQYLDKLETDKLKVIYEDFMSADIFNEIKDIPYKNLYVIGNLPYYITTPIITRLIDLKLPIKEAVFMVQKEVAERFSARPGHREYGSISVFLNYFFNITKLFVVKRGSFTPAPNVDSEVIKFTSKELIPVDFELFNKFVKASFQMKRKNLRNNLRNYDLEKLEKILNELGYSLQNRAEDLDYTDYIKIVCNLV